jgi:hypothetical protein
MELVREGGPELGADEAGVLSTTMVLMIDLDEPFSSLLGWLVYGISTRTGPLCSSCMGEVGRVGRFMVAVESRADR